MATVAGLAIKLPTEIPGVRNLAFFKPKDAQYFAKILKEDETELFIDEMKERKIKSSPSQNQERHPSRPKNRSPTNHRQSSRSLELVPPSYGACS